MDLSEETNDYWKNKYNKELVGKVFIVKTSSYFVKCIEYSFHKNNTSEEMVGLIKWEESTDDSDYSNSYSYCEIFIHINKGHWIIINTKNLLIEKSNIKNYGIFQKKK